MTFVSTLEPKELWQHFDRILTIPRGSKNEEAIRQYVLKTASANQLEVVRDHVGNVLVRKSGTTGYGGGPCVVLQCHLDMVNEKNSDVQHDFSSDPIRPRIDGDYLAATGTTLGADNGIGIATCLALLEDKNGAHGPLECLFTVDEETGLTGASALQPGFLTGAYLVNLDSEEECTIYVGCAGGSGTDLTLNGNRTPVPSGSRTVILQLSGLKGGHSGVDIHLQRGNAIQLLARILNAALPSFPVQIESFNGGNMHNAIPREATSVVVLPEGRVPGFEKEVQLQFSQIAAEYKPVEDEMKLSISAETSEGTALDQASSKRLVSLLVAIPHGVLSMSYDIPELVETSSNLATVRTDGNEVFIHVSTRSSVASSLLGIGQRISALGTLAGAQAREIEGYPGWQPNLQSELLKITKQAHRDELHCEPQVKAIHAGLECGIIKKVYPTMDMVSIGPQIEFPHSPDERVRIESVDRFYRVLKTILRRLGAQG